MTDAEVKAGLQRDFELLHKKGSDDLALENCAALQTLEPVQLAISAKARPARAARILLRMAAERAPEGAAREVRAAAAITGIEPRSTGPGGRGHPGPYTRQENAGRIDGGISDRAARGKRESVYYPAYAAAVLDLVDDLMTNEVLWAKYLERCGITKVLESRTDQGDGPPTIPNRPIGFVRRPTVEAQFRTYVTDGVKLIALVGLPGMGKTALAQALTAGSPFFEVQGGKLPLADLRSALRAYNLYADELTEVSAWERLGDLMTAIHGPEFVVLDNLDSTSELRSLIPHNTTTVVVATAREAGHRAPSSCQYVSVNAMEPMEAEALTRALLPSLSEDDVRFMASCLEHYPLAIQIASSYITNTGVETRTLCSSIRDFPGSLEAGTGERLRAILERIVKELCLHNPIATELLACIVTADSHLFSAQVPHLRIFIQQCHSEEEPVTACAEAIQVLQRFSLVQVYLPSPHMGFKEGFVSPRHPLVQKILRRLLKDVASHVDALLCQSLARLKEEISACPGPVLPWPALNEPLDTLDDEAWVLGLMLNRTAEPLPEHLHGDPSALFALLAPDPWVKLDDPILIRENYYYEIETLITARMESPEPAFERPTERHHRSAMP